MSNIVAFLVFPLVGALYYLYIQPEYESIVDRRAEVSEIQSVLDKHELFLQLQDDLLAKVNGVSRTDLERLTQLLPETVEPTNVLVELDTLAGRHGLLFDSPSFSASAPRGQGQDLRGQDAAVTAGTPVATALTFVVSGTYDAMLGFLADLEKQLRIVDVTKLAFDATDDADGAGTARSITTFNFTVQFYSLQ